MQTVLLTGANGFIGSYIIKYLQTKGCKIIATGKGKARLPFTGPNVIYESLDFTSKEEIRKVFAAYQPHLIIHSGALSKPDECDADKAAAYKTNVTGTEFLLEEAAHRKCFFIFLSTDFIFSGEAGMYNEEDEAGPINYYGETKLLAEGLVKKYVHPWSIVRTVLVYGAPQGGRDNIVTSVAKALAKGETLRIYNDQVRTPTYVEDVAKAIVTIADRKATGVYHIAGKDVRTPYAMACTVADYLKLDKKGINKVTRETFPQGALRPLKTGFDISKARKLLGYEPISFKEGLKKTFEYLQD